jgi:hypothetical protein
MSAKIPALKKATVASVASMPKADAPVKKARAPRPKAELDPLDKELRAKESAIHALVTAASLSYTPCPPGRVQKLMLETFDALADRGPLYRASKVHVVEVIVMTRLEHAQMELVWEYDGLGQHCTRSATKDPANLNKCLANAIRQAVAGILRAIRDHAANPQPAAVKDETGAVVQRDAVALPKVAAPAKKKKKKPAAAAPPAGAGRGIPLKLAKKPSQSAQLAFVST